MPRRPRVLVLVASLAVVLMSCTAGDDAADADEPSDQQVGDGAGVNGDTDDEVEPLDLVAGDALTLCVEPSHPPFVVVDEDAELGYGGFEVELLEEVARSVELGPITVVEAGFEDIASGAAMAEGRCDVAASAIEVTEARAERIDFTEPHYGARQSLLVRAGSQIDDLDDLGPGMVIGVQRDTAAADRVADQAEGVETRTYDDADGLFAAFDDGALDAVLHDLAVNLSLAQSQDGVVVVERYEPVEEFAFAVARERDDHLLEVLNDALQRSREDGSMLALIERHFWRD